MPGASAQLKGGLLSVSRRCGAQAQLDGRGAQRVGARGHRRRHRRHRRILGVDEGENEGLEGWRGFLRHLKERGLSGVQLIISDAWG
jgi:hypothetical protein